LILSEVIAESRGDEKNQVQRQLKQGH